MAWRHPHPDELLTLYVNGTLDLQTQRNLQSHLAACRRCRQEVKFIAALRAVVKEVYSEETPPRRGMGNFKRLIE